MIGVYSTLYGNIDRSSFIVKFPLLLFVSCVFIWLNRQTDSFRIIGKLMDLLDQPDRNDPCFDGQLSSPPFFFLDKRITRRGCVLHNRRCRIPLDIFTIIVKMLCFCTIEISEEVLPFLLCFIVRFQIYFTGRQFFLRPQLQSFNRY